jgi:hypothetical protein
VLELLYGGNTLSFFDTDMVSCFFRKASSDGIYCIRNVHLAIRLELSHGRASATDCRKAEKALAILDTRLPHLQQLDVEVVLTWGEPQDAAAIWQWLIGETMMGRFRGRGLHAFVLKVSVLEFKVDPDFRGGYEGYTPDISRLTAWDDRDYQDLKESAMQFSQRELSS